jgi:predicted dienelactone hydrolase
VDAARDDRELVVDVWYPVDAADAATEPRTEYPLQGGLTLPSDVAVDDLPVSSEVKRPFLVFSHGFGGINTQSTQLMEALASHGFIIASPEHTGNTALDHSDDMPAEKRVPDVSFIIDTLFERSNTPGDAFEGRIDESKVGVLGHSYGGSTAMGTVAGWAGADPDPRVKAIGVIAGGVGNNSFSETVLSDVTQPTILLVGTLDPNALANHQYAFANMPNAEALFKVEVTGANHTHFANICDIGNRLISLGITQDQWDALGAAALLQPYNDTCTEDVFPIAEAHRLQNLYMVAHFRRFLLDQVGYNQFLTAAYADANEPAVSFESK